MAKDMMAVFDATKAIEAMLYLAHKLSDSRIYTICKMLYLADKISLEKYGRLIFGETYVAMEHGATPSNAYDLLKKSKDDHRFGLSVNDKYVTPLRKATLDYLSETDIECLNKVAELYDNADSQRFDGVHDSAWEKAWDSRGAKGSNKMPLRSIVDTLPNSTELIEYLTGFESN